MEFVFIQTLHSVRRSAKRHITPVLNRRIEQHPQQKHHHPQTNIRFIATIPQKSEFFSFQNSVHFHAPNQCLRPIVYQTFLTNRRCFRTLAKATLLNPSEVESSLKENQVPYQKGYTGFLTKCHKCNSGETETDLNLFIDSRTGATTCTACGCQQDWKMFLKDLIKSNNTHSTITQARPEVVLMKNSPEHVQLWKNSEAIPSCHTYSLLDGVKHSILERFRVRVTSDNHVMFSCYDITKNILVEVKVYDSEGTQILHIANDETTPRLFGWHSITKTDSKIVLTTSEFDSIAVTHATGVPALTVCGTTHSSDILPFLEQFSEIILWFNNDYRDQQDLQTFASKLGLQRCHKVSSSNGAHAMFRQNGTKAVVDVIDGARGMSHDCIVTYKDFENELYLQLNNAKINAGVPFTRFPVLNEYLKGHRRGELTVFTGPTGSGKTTFLSELSLDLCAQGVRTLWGSFEIKNLRLLNTLIHQFSGFAIENHIDKFAQWSEKFRNLPLYFMNYYGAQNLNDVINTIEYAVYMYNIEHVIIDNLQFMITTLGNSDDKFQAMDRAIAAFRQCASNHNVHVTVVVHPRKENDGGSLQTASIYGSAKASQEADNVLILQTSDQLSMQVTKNRFCGTIGLLPLSFNPDSLCLSGFHRNVDTGEAILPQLPVRRPVRNVQILKQTKK